MAQNKFNTRVESLRQQLENSTMSGYYTKWNEEIKRRAEAETKLDKQIKRNKMMGRYLMAHIRRLRSTKDEENNREAQALMSMLRGYYDDYKFTDVAPVRWVTMESVDRNPDYYKVIKRMDGLKDDGTLAQWCLIVPAKEYPRCPLEDCDDPTV